MKAPAKGVMNTCGSNAMIDAVASTDADPVVLVNHHTSENWTSLLPNRLKACPVNIAQKSLMGLGVL
jgi:hypothetical protein